MCVCEPHSVGYYPPELASETQTDGILSSGKDAQFAQKYDNDDEQAFISINCTVVLFEKSDEFYLNGGGTLSLSLGDYDHRTGSRNGTFANYK